MKVGPQVKRMLSSCVVLSTVAAIAAGLPEGYEPIFGISSTSSGRQYVYTDYVPSSCNVTVEAKVSLNGFSTQCIWCSRGSGTGSQTMTVFLWSSPNFFRIDRNGNTGTYANLQPATGTPVTLVGDYKNLTFTIDGEEVKSKMASGDFTPGGRMSFFASHTNGGGWGNYGLYTLHHVRVYAADGSLEREFLPVRSAANAGTKQEYGLYETTKGTYFSVPSSATAAFVPVEETSYSCTEDEASDSLVFDVKGSYALTADDVARIESTTRRNLVKIGTGTLIGSPIANFTGNLVVSQGVFRICHQYDVGADGNGWIRVMDGATLEIQNGKRSLTGKTIYTTGNGVGGMGAIAGGGTWDTCSKCRFVLEGDSLYRATAELNFLHDIDLAGHKLTGLNTQTTQRWGISGTTITNSLGAASPAVFDFAGGMIRPESMSNFRGRREDGVVKFHSDSSYGCVGVLTSGFTSVWPIEMGPNVRMAARRKPDRTQKDVGVISGPITLRDNVRLAWDVDAKTNSLINLKGTLAGSGTLDIGSGWVNFHTKANDYAGVVTVSRSNTLASADFRAGIGIEKKAVYSAASTTLENADMDFFEGQGEVRGPLHFTGDAQCRMLGGTYAGERTKLGLVTKTGSGELYMAAGVTVTGRLEVADGKLRFPTRAENLPVVGRPGLMGSVTDAARWSFASPDDGTSEGVECRYDTLYPHGNDLTSRWDGSAQTTSRTTMVRGYIWNRTGTTQNWSFWAQHNWTLWFWLDGEKVFSETHPSSDTSSIRTLSISPGPHEYVLITTGNAGGGPNYIKWVSGKGSLYDSLPIDFQGRGEANGANFSPSYDPGDGSLFTVDDKVIDETTDPFWLPEITTAAFASGAEFDVGEYAYRLPKLEGFPKVTHVKTLTVGESWTLDDVGIGAGRAMTVAGTLKFEDGAVLDVSTDPGVLSWPARQKLAAGLTIATATAIEGLPTLSDRLVKAGATFEKSADGASLFLTVPTKRYAKLVDGAVEIGYAADEGKPAKEVRIDVYRDGVCIDTQFVGDGYRKMAGAWTYPGDGAYFAVATTSTEEGVRQDVFADLMVAGADSRIVSTAPGDGEYASVLAAVQSLGDAGGRVYVKPGVYAENVLTNGVELTAPVKVIGLAADPGEVVVTRNTARQSRIFTLANADAAIRFLTVTGGELPSTTDYKEGNGGNVLVRAAGGTVENCVLKDGSCFYCWVAGGGNIALWGGRMSNCRIIGGRTNSEDTNQWRQFGGSVMASGNALVENCLITDCKPAVSRSGCAPIGLYGKAKLVNCTVANNEGKSCGGVMLFKNDSNQPQVVNCAFFGNAARDASAEARHAVYKSILCYRTNSGNNGCTDDEAAAAFVNCAATVDVNDTCLKTDAPLFTDATNGDYTLRAESPLVNAGANTGAFGAVATTDLLGNPRTSKKIDIGCFEWRQPKLESKFLYILIARDGSTSAPANGIVCRK